MPIRITLDLFSGRPNPTVTLSDREAKSILTRLAPDKKLSRDQAESPPSLGYRGLIIEQSGRPGRGLPKVFRLSAGRLYGADLAHLVAEPGIEEELLTRPGFLKKFGVRGLTPDQLEKLIRYRYRLFHRWHWHGHFPKRPVCPCAPVYEPAWWNDGGQRQGGNNCYNYGCNYRTDTFAQPGQASGAMYGFPIDGPGVKNGAIHDDLIDAPAANNKCPRSGGHLVALVIAPSSSFNDFHWYRKGLNGRWTHKPGGTQATNLDNSGNLITDPRTADRGPYTQFTTFMIVKHGHIKIK